MYLRALVLSGLAAATLLLATACTAILLESPLGDPPADPDRLRHLDGAWRALALDEDIHISVVWLRPTDLREGEFLLGVAGMDDDDMKTYRAKLWIRPAGEAFLVSLRELLSPDEPTTAPLLFVGRLTVRDRFMILHGVDPDAVKKAAQAGTIPGELVGGDVLLTPSPDLNDALTSPPTMLLNWTEPILLQKL